MLRARLEHERSGRPAAAGRRWGLTLLGGFVLGLSVQHVAAPHLNVAQHMVSEYANGPHGGLMRSAFIAWGLSLGATAAVAAAAAGRGAVYVAALLVAATVCLFCVAVFPTDTVAGRLPLGERRSVAGAVHDWAGQVALVALALAMVVSLRLPWWRPTRTAVGVGLASSAVLAACLLVAGPAVAGLRQRELIVAAVVWQSAFLCGAGRVEPRLR